MSFGPLGVEMKQFLFVLPLLAFSALNLSRPTIGQSATLWELGKLDQSIREFGAIPGSHVVYQVGKSDWAQDWPGVQTSGSLYEIHFNLSAAPRGVYQLKVSALTSYPEPRPCRLKSMGTRGSIICTPGHSTWQTSDIAPRIYWRLRFPQHI